MRKRFDRELYNQVDALAKEKAKSLLNATAYNPVENPKKTQVDLQVFDKDQAHLFNIECEVKLIWKTVDFPYESVQIPKRKEKYAILDKPTLFVMFNHDQSAYLVIKSTDLVASPCVEVPNKYVYKGEFFYQVPLDKVSFNNILKPIKEILK